MGWDRVGCHESRETQLSMNKISIPITDMIKPRVSNLLFDCIPVIIDSIGFSEVKP